MSLDYDGVTSLRLEIKKRLNKTSHTTQADYIAAACNALGFEKREKGASGKPVENVAILKWLLENKTATRNKSQNKAQALLPQITETPAPIIEAVEIVEPIQQKTPKQYANKYQFKSVAFNTSDGKNKTRHVIKLENYFIEALKQIGVDNLPAFLSEITTTEWNKSTGDKSIMKIVKASIVNELLKKAGNKQNGKV